MSSKVTIGAEGRSAFVQQFGSKHPPLPTQQSAGDHHGGARGDDLGNPFAPSQYLGAWQGTDTASRRTPSPSDALTRPGSQLSRRGVAPIPVAGSPERSLWTLRSLPCSPVEDDWCPGQETAGRTESWELVAPVSPVSWPVFGDVPVTAAQACGASVGSAEREGSVAAERASRKRKPEEEAGAEQGAAAESSSDRSKQRRTQGSAWPRVDIVPKRAAKFQEANEELANLVAQCQALLVARGITAPASVERAMRPSEEVLRPAERETIVSDSQGLTKANIESVVRGLGLSKRQERLVLAQTDMIVAAVHDSLPPVKTTQPRFGLEPLATKLSIDPEKQEEFLDGIVDVRRRAVQNISLKKHRRTWGDIGQSKLDQLQSRIFTVRGFIATVHEQPHWFSGSN